jgi:flagellar biosynthesis GTPase FlhF
MPTPRKGESKDDFVGRCMGNKVMKGEFSDNKQRLAVCYSQWGKVRGEKMEDWRKLNYLVPIKETFSSGQDFIIKGIAINETTTRNGVKYIADELSIAAHTLRNKPILKDHKNEVDSIVGRTTENINFDVSIGAIPFEGKIMDNDIKQKIKDGRLQSVSVGAMVKDLEEGEQGEKIAKGIDFVELSLVAVPADPNAGLARAICNSFELKNKEAIEVDNKAVLEESSESSEQEEVKKMTEEKNEKLEEAQETIKKLNEELEGFKREAEEVKKKEDIKEIVKSVLEEQEEPKEEEQPAEEEKEEEEKPEEPEDETKGEVGEAEEEKEETAEESLHVGEDSEGLSKGFSIYRETYNPEKFKRLAR